VELAAWLVVGGALVGLAFAASFYLSIQSARRSTEVEVPDVLGLDLEEAARRVDPFDLVPQVVSQRHDRAVASGRVLEQIPIPGSSVRRGRKIKLVVSLGSEVLQVPDHVGEAAREAQYELPQEGFAPGDEARVPWTRAAAGTVIGQVPPPDTPAVPNSRVHLLVSDGPPESAWVMPDLTGLRREQAERWIDRSGFRRGAVRRVRMVGRPAETVVGQQPLAGHPVRPRDAVDLTLAQGT